MQPLQHLDGSMSQPTTVYPEQHERAQFCSMYTRELLLHSPCAAHALHEACKSLPQLVGVAVVAATVLTVELDEQAGLQLRAQFWSIHACDWPVHCPWDAQPLHEACKSVPEQPDVAAERGADVMKTGAGVRATTATGAAVVAEQAGVQLLAQLLAIQTRELPVHCPCAAHVVHVACVSAPQLTGGVGTMTGAGERGAKVAEPHAGLQLRAQLVSM